MSTDQSVELAISPRQERAIAARDAIEGGGRALALIPRTFLEAQAFAGALATSDLIPSKLKDRAADVLVIILAGVEIGLAPMQSLRLHHVIEGIPRLAADGIAAVVMASHLCMYLECSESSDTRCTWVTQRRGRPERSCTWTIERAKRAGLTEKKNRDGSPGMWMKYPENMLSARAKGELCKMVYPDIAGGLVSREEAMDGAIDAEFTEVPTRFVAPPPPSNAVPVAPVVAVGSGPVAAAEPAKRGPGRPPKDKAIDTTATVVEPPPIAKLDAAVEAARKRDAERAEAAEIERAAVAAVAPVNPTPPASPTTPPPSTGSGSSTTTATSSGVSPAPAAADEASWGEDPPDVTQPTRTIEAFFAWLASCPNQRVLEAGKAEWIAWSKQTYEAQSDGAKTMRKAFAERNAAVPA